MKQKLSNNYYLNKPIKKYFIKNKCKQFENLLNKRDNDILESINDIFREEIKDIRFKIHWDNNYNHLCISINKKILDMTGKWLDTHGMKDISEKTIKTMSLANFIFKECNPYGLIILEKSVLANI